MYHDFTIGIPDAKGKITVSIRLAIRNEEDNNRLISVLCAIDANSDTLVLE